MKLINFMLQHYIRDHAIQRFSCNLISVPKDHPPLDSDYPNQIRAFISPLAEFPFH